MTTLSTWFVGLVLVTACSGVGGGIDASKDERRISGQISGRDIGNTEDVHVIATSSSGDVTTASVLGDGSFDLPLLDTESYLLGFATEGRFLATLVFNSGSGTATQVIPIGTERIGLGSVSLEDGNALPETNPLSNTDTNGNGVPDLSDGYEPLAVVGFSGAFDFQVEDTNTFVSVEFIQDDVNPFKLGYHYDDLACSDRRTADLEKFGDGFRFSDIDIRQTGDCVSELTFALVGETTAGVISGNMIRHERYTELSPGACDGALDQYWDTPFTASGNSVVCAPKVDQCIEGECIDSVCGNGIVEAKETCDDGIIDGGRGCANCTIDLGYTCTGAPSVCGIDNLGSFSPGQTIVITNDTGLPAQGTHFYELTVLDEVVLNGTLIGETIGDETIWMSINDDLERKIVGSEWSVFLQPGTFVLEVSANVPTSGWTLSLEGTPIVEVGSFSAGESIPALKRVEVASKELTVYKVIFAVDIVFDILLAASTSVDLFVLSTPPQTWVSFELDGQIGESLSVYLGITQQAFLGETLPTGTYYFVVVGGGNGELPVVDEFILNLFLE